MNNTRAPSLSADIKPKPRTYLEKIGDQEWDLVEAKLDVEQDIVLWSDNPRIQTTLMTGIASELELEATLQRTPGYEPLRRSIDDLGQMEPIYVWRADENSKYIVFEGATRVCILRELNRKYASGPKAGRHRWVKAKVLPSHFGELERAILLARIHVRGTGVRAWGRYIEAKFIFETVEDRDGHRALMSATEMARYMEKSLSWVTRLRDAYKFARKFVEHIDNDESEKLAADHFSTLEEISKASVIGAQLRDYDNSKYDTLRTDVFDMVRNEAFKEYREARFLKEFHDDSDKWEQLKSGEKHIASRLAMDVKTNAGSVKTKISTVEQQIQRAIERKEAEFDDDDIDALQRAIGRIHEQIHPGVRPFRVALKGTTRTLSEASMADVKALSPEELEEFREAVDYFDGLVAKHGKAA
jgi:hypothetical protein